jgi:hypothetical protein
MSTRPTDYRSTCRHLVTNRYTTGGSPTNSISSIFQPLNIQPTSVVSSVRRRYAVNDAATDNLGQSVLWNPLRIALDDQSVIDSTPSRFPS